MTAGDRRSARDVICDALAGASAGAIAATIMCPLDVIKTRLQVHGPPDLSNSGHKGGVIITSLQNIIRTEGVMGLYRGLSPTLVALLPNWAVYFAVYGNLKSLFHSHDNNGQLTLGANMVAASGAGAATAIATNPVWVVKTRLQLVKLLLVATHATWGKRKRNSVSTYFDIAYSSTSFVLAMRHDAVPYKSVLSALRRILHEEGIRGWYSGLLPSLVGITHVAIQFPAYESIKSYLAKKDSTTTNELSPSKVAIASSMSKIGASMISYPHEVIRSRLQEQGQVRTSEKQYAGVVDCAKQVMQKEGFSGFYRGCATNLLRTTPSAVITFTAYEMIHRFLERTIPPEKKHSKTRPRPDGHMKSRGNEGIGGSSDCDSSQSGTTFSRTIYFVPLGNTDPMTAGH